MVLNSKALIGLPVRTKSGAAIGKVSSVDLDSDTGKLAAVRVRVSGVVPRLLNNELAVPWAHIVSIDEREVVIADAFVPMGVTRLASQQST